MLVLAAICACALSARADERARVRTTDELVQLYGLAGLHGALTGFTISALAFDDSVVATSITGVISAAGEGAVVRLVDLRSRFGYGAPQAMVSDAWIGTGIAAAWIWRNSTVANDPWSTKARALLLWSGATAGAGLGAVRWYLAPSSPGRAALLGSSALWTGAVSGLATAAIDSRDREQSASLATAVGIELGVIGGAVLLPKSDTAISRVRALDGGAALGGLIGAGTVALLQGGPLDSRAALASAAVGIVGGGLIGWFLAPSLQTEGPRLGLRLPAEGGIFVSAALDSQ